MRFCDYCAGKLPASKPRNARFCSVDCRRASARRPAGDPPAAAPVVTPLPVAPPPSAVDPLVKAVRDALDAAGRLDTVPGRQAVALAEAMAGASGTALAALSRELRTVQAEAMRGVQTKVDPIDELKKRRDRKSG